MDSLTMLMEGFGNALTPTNLLFAVLGVMLGTAVGGRILDRLSDASFRTATRWVVTAVGVTYLVQAARLA